MHRTQLLALLSVPFAAGRTIDIRQIGDQTYCGRGEKPNVDSCRSAIGLINTQSGFYNKGNEFRYGDCSVIAAEGSSGSIPGQAFVDLANDILSNCNVLGWAYKSGVNVSISQCNVCGGGICTRCNSPGQGPLRKRNIIELDDMAPSPVERSAPSKVQPVAKRDETPKPGMICGAGAAADISSCNELADILGKMQNVPLPFTTAHSGDEGYARVCQFALQPTTGEGETADSGKVSQMLKDITDTCKDPTGKYVGRMTNTNAVLRHFETPVQDSLKIVSDMINFSTSALSQYYTNGDFNIRAHSTPSRTRIPWWPSSWSKRHFEALMVGFEAAVKYAQKGASKLIFAVRSLQKGEEAKIKIVERSGRDADCITVMQVDLNTFASVQAFVKALEKETAQLQTVLLCAGLANPKIIKSREEWEMSVQVNVLSTALMAVELLPLLRKTAASTGEPPHLTFVTSFGHSEVKSGWFKGQTLLSRADDESQYDNEKSYHMVKLLGMAAMLRIVKEQRRQTYLTARTAEEGSRTLLGATTLGPESQGKFWNHDILYPLGKFAKDEKLLTETWDEIERVIEKSEPNVESLLRVWSGQIVQILETSVLGRSCRRFFQDSKIWV
ncbi:hypothetical protein BDV95DRAFT_654374 [Massariosphaeria phaeospora]|uniref:Uncharacterized protein n=1 Tax=Massariosphaeria phaeospora TaxID=100035 RepID=A0A7C8MUW6_9PLEO|nr:hypothetical protein BDV95DRAFT_654374 [Massariosphaeria phaeospora]